MSRSTALHPFVSAFVHGSVLRTNSLNCNSSLCSYGTRIRLRQGCPRFQLRACSSSTAESIRTEGASSKLEQLSSRIDPPIPPGLFRSQRIFVVDGFGLLFRSYYALVSTTMTSVNLFDTRAVYGFANVLLSLLSKHVNGEPVVVVFEGERKPGEVDHRRASYPEYKSGRKQTPPGIIAAIPWIRKLIQALGLSILEHPLFEADDVIGTFVRRAKAENIRTVIVSIDKDFLQLLESDLVTILKPGSSSKSFEYVTEESFREKFLDLHPSKYIDILTLIGDNADSIKGVPGIGPTTAPKLIRQFGSVEKLLDAAKHWDSVVPANMQPDELKEYKQMRKILTPSRAKNLRLYEQRTLLMKSMVTIRDNVNLPNDHWNNFLRRKVRCSEVDLICDRLEFNSRPLRSRMYRSADTVPENFLIDATTEDFLGGEEEFDSVPLINAEELATDASLISNRSPVPLEYEVIDDEEDIARVLKDVTKNVGYSGLFSGELDGVPVLDAIAVSIEPGLLIFIDCSNRHALPPSVIKVLTDESIEKVGWNMKDNMKALLARYNVYMKGRLFDVRIAADLIHGGQYSTDSSLIKKYLGSEAVLRMNADHLKRISVPSSKTDCLTISEFGFRLAKDLRDDMKAKEIENIADHVEFPLIPVLAEMEMHGVPLNRKDLKSFENEVKKRLEVIENELSLLIPSEFVGTFRPTSTEDVSKVLYEIWKLKPPAKATPSGKLPTNKGVLTSFSNNENLMINQREFVSLLIKYRETRTILSSYARALLRSIHSDDRVRTTFVQDCTRSGRLSTSHPNLQSIPVKSSLGRKVRSTIRSKAGFGILCADYSQIELRILAALSNDRDLKEAFRNNEDIHTKFAAKFFNTDQVSGVERSAAKQVIYGILYGMSAKSLAQELSITSSESRKLIASFRLQFPVVHQFTQNLIAKARELGYAETIAGRRLFLPALLHGSPQERRGAERVAINMPVQGTQADMIKIAMIHISERLREEQAESKLILQLHDELIFEVAESERTHVEEIVTEEMSSALPLPGGVEVAVNVSYGDSWGAN